VNTSDPKVRPAISPSAHVWVVGAPGAPFGGRVLGRSEDGRYWIDVCIMGQHLPQMYDPRELHELEANDCERLGLCPDCLGFGDTGDFEKIRTSSNMVTVARRSDDPIVVRCVTCSGSGRPSVQTVVVDKGTSLYGTIIIRPHRYVSPLRMDQLSQAELFYVRNPELFGAGDGMCLACSLSLDGRDRQGNTIHVQTDTEKEADNA